MKPAAEARARELLLTMNATKAADQLRAEGMKCGCGSIQALRRQMISEGLVKGPAISLPADDDGIAADNRARKAATEGSRKLLAAINAMRARQKAAA